MNQKYQKHKNTKDQRNQRNQRTYSYFGGGGIKKTKSYKTCCLLQVGVRMNWTRCASTCDSMYRPARASNTVQWVPWFCIPKFPNKSNKQYNTSEKINKQNIWTQIKSNKSNKTKKDMTYITVLAEVHRSRDSTIHHETVPDCKIHLATLHSLAWQIWQCRWDCPMKIMKKMTRPVGLTSWAEMLQISGICMVIYVIWAFRNIINIYIYILNNSYILIIL